MSNAPERAADWRPGASKPVPERFAEMAMMQARCPVAFSDENGGFWALLRYEDIVRASTDVARFSNSAAPIYGRALPPLEFDPPLHSMFRSCLAPFFTPRAVRRVEGEVRRAARRLLKPIQKAAGGDLAEDFAYPLPLVGLLGLMEAPTNLPEAAAYGRVARHMEAADDDLRTAAQGEYEARVTDLIGAVVDDRERRGELTGQDLLGALLLKRRSDPNYAGDIVERILRLLFGAGHHTTSAAIGNLLLLLIERPEIQTRLRANPMLIPGAVEEILRWEAPVQEMHRFATGDHDLRGRRIAAGERVSLFWGAANRDATVFPEPDEFRLDRAPNRHLAFGHGLHSCIGAPLARLQIRVAVESVLDCFSGIRLDGEVLRMPFRRMGVARLPVKVDGAGRTST